MEAYAAYSDLAGMRELSQNLFQEIARKACGCEEGHEVLTYQGTEVDLSGNWRVASLAEIASEVTGEEFMNILKRENTFAPVVENTNEEGSSTSSAE